MIQPKHNPQEALERIKLMMKYDSSKTLTENVEEIQEQNTGTKTAISTGIAAGTGAAVAGGAAAANVATTTALGSATYSAVGLGSSLGVQSTIGAAALGGAVFAGAAALAITPLVIWYMDKDNAKPKVERILKYCISDKDKISKVPRKVEDTKIRDLSDQLFDAMEGVGTNEEAVYGVFKSLQTASDFCALVDRFNKDYGNQGDLMEWLDDDFDATSEWEQIYRPIRNVVEDTLLAIKDETVEDKCKTNPNDPACKKEVKKDEKKTSQYHSCPETFPIAMYCKNETIRKVQKCLGIVPDSAFGPKTQAALEAKSFSGKEITQDTVDKVCGGSTPWTDAETEDTASTNTGGGPTISAGSTSDTDDMS